MLRVKCVILILCFAFSAFLLYPGPVTAITEERPQSLDNAYQEAEDSLKLDIIVLEQPSQKFLANHGLFPGLSVNSINGLSGLHSKKPVCAIWVTKQMQHEAFSENGVSVLSNLIDEGYALVFPGVDDVNILKETFTNDKSREVVEESNLTLLASTIAKNHDGEYVIAHLYSDKDLHHEDNIRNLIGMSWIYGNIKNTVRKEFEYNAVKTLDSEISVLGPSIQSIDDLHWTTVSSPWAPVTIMEDVYLSSNNGTAVEWRQGFFTEIQGIQYFALCFEHFMEPTIDELSIYRYSSRQLSLQSNLDHYLQSNTLRDYYPYESPDQNTFDVGISWGEGEPTIEATWQVTQEDLTLDIQGTGDSYRAVDINFIYNRYWYGPSQYAQTSSRQAAGWVIRNNHPDDPFAIMHNRREAWFDEWLTGGLWTRTGTTSGYINSYLYLYPSNAYGD